MCPLESPRLARLSALPLVSAPLCAPHRMIDLRTTLTSQLKGRRGRRGCHHDGLPLTGVLARVRHAERERLMPQSSFLTIVMICSYTLYRVLRCPGTCRSRPLVLLLLLLSRFLLSPWSYLGSSYYLGPVATPSTILVLSQRSPVGRSAPLALEPSTLQVLDE